MFENAIKIPSKINSKILLKVVPGHFATSHSHTAFPGSALSHENVVPAHLYQYASRMR